MEQVTTIKESRFKEGDEVGVDVQHGVVEFVEHWEGCDRYRIMTPKGFLLMVPEDYLVKILEPDFDLERKSKDGWEK